MAPAEGAVELWSSVLQPTEDSLPVIVEDIEIREGTVDRAVDAPDPPPPPTGTVTRWGLTDAFRVEEAPAGSVPPGASFTVRAAEPDGTLLVDRHVTRPPGEGAVAVAAGLVLESPDPRRVPVELGFSDYAVVLLDGEPVYEGDLSYGYDAPQRAGFFVRDQNILHLPLQAGRHELVVLVTEVFGGWAVAARVLSDGVTVRPMR